MLAWRCLKANLIALHRRRSYIAEEVGHCSIATVITAFPDLPRQALTCQSGKGFDPVTKIGRIRINHRRTRLSRAIGWSFQSPARYIYAPSFDRCLFASKWLKPSGPADAGPGTRYGSERFFNRIKHYRGIATRYDKNPANFLAAVKLIAIRVIPRF